MKTKMVGKTLRFAVVGGLAFLAWNASAQQTSGNAVPQLPGGAVQVLQLEQAKVGDDTIISYIKSSGTGYVLNADQIIYLRQQGVSDVVLTTMLNQPKVGFATTASCPKPAISTPEPAAPAPAVGTVTAPTTVVQPAVTYVQTAPATYYYYPAVYYPAYRYRGCSPVSVSVGVGCGWHVGVGWCGGWHCH